MPALKEKKYKLIQFFFLAEQSLFFKQQACSLSLFFHTKFIIKAEVNRDLTFTTEMHICEIRNFVDWIRQN